MKIQSTNVFEEQVNRIFTKHKSDEVELILKALSLILYSTQNNTDIVELYRTIGLDAFIKIINLFDGRTVKFPPKKVIKNYLILALSYYYKEVEGKDWETIKQEFPFDITSISYGIQIKNLNNFIKQKMYEILKNLHKNGEITPFDTIFVEEEKSNGTRN